MNIIIEQPLLDRSPGIKDLFRMACELILSAKKPSQIIVRQLTSRTGVNGLVYRAEEGIFVIEVGELDAGSMFKTLVHELTHIAQFISGKLKRCSAGWIWKESYFPSHTPYAARPWEIEARTVSRRVLRTMEGCV